MKSLIIAVCILFTQNLLAQSFFSIIKIDSARWRIQEQIPTSKGGGGTINLSDIADSTTIVSRFINLTEMKRAAIENRVLEKDYAALNAELKRVTGSDYEDLLNAKIASFLPGAWNIASQGDSISVIISKNLLVSGGKIKGSAQVISQDSIVLSGVYPKPVTMRMVSVKKMEENKPCPESTKPPCPKIIMTKQE